MKFSKLLKEKGVSAPDLEVWAFIPYCQEASGMTSDQYDTPYTRQELKDVFKALGLDWEWIPITNQNLHLTVDSLLASCNGKMPVVLNYCDGDEIYDFPGIEVVRRLEKEGLAYTGANADFYHLSTSKIRMKDAFVRGGVSTAPYAVITDPERDCPGLCERLGTPLFVKPAVSAGSVGLSLKSVVHNDEDLRAQVDYLLSRPDGNLFDRGGIFAERFVNGPEFTVLVVGIPGIPETIRVYPPVERHFNTSIPEEERFFSYERYWELWNNEPAPPDGKPLYQYRSPEPELQERLKELSWRAFCAVEGAGYGRVDIRMEKSTGELYVLEVNANCGISSSEDDSSTGNILKLGGITFPQLMGDLLFCALFRNKRNGAI